MTPVRVQSANGKFKVITMAGNPIGPRLWGSEPPNGLPPIKDEYDTKSDAQECADLWNAYHLWCQDRSGKRKRK